jgi:hypothetical protein
VKRYWDEALLHWAKAHWLLAWPSSHGLASPWAGSPLRNKGGAPGGSTVAARPFPAMLAARWVGACGKSTIEWWWTDLR